MELPPELILELTEHLDMATLRTLMFVNKVRLPRTEMRLCLREAS